MTIVNLIIEPAQRRVVTQRRHAAGPEAGGRGSLYSLISLCAVLAACGPSQTGELEQPLAPTTARTSSAALTASADFPADPQANGASQYEPANAAGDGIYLVIWTQPSAGGRDVVGARFNATDNTPLDANPIHIGTTTLMPAAPAVAFGGGTFLVVWEQESYDGHLIYGARVRASDGAVLDTPFVISLLPYGRYGVQTQSKPSVAFDGTNFLVIWEGASPIASQYDYHYGIQGIRVRASDGTLVESTRFNIFYPADSSTGFPGYSDVAYTDGNYLVAWSRGGNIEAVRVQAATAQVLDSSPIIVGGGDLPSVAARSGELLVAWYGNSLWARRLAASSGALLDSSPITVGPSPVSPPDATFDGVNYQIIWQAYQPYTGLPYITTAVSPQGTVAADANVVLYNPGYVGYWMRGGVASLGSGSILASYAWQAAENASVQIHLRRVTEPMECTSAEPSLVLNGSAEMTVECGSGTYSDPGAQAFDGCGDPMTVHAYNTGADSSGPGPNLGLEGTYSVSYSVWDNYGHALSSVRTVIVDDRTAPTLTLNGAAHMTHTCGSQWVDPGVVATDACYGNLTAQVWHTGEVNGWAVGTYTVTYTVTDAGGNSVTPVTRTVDVVNCPW